MRADLGLAERGAAGAAAAALEGPAPLLFASSPSSSSAPPLLSTIVALRLLSSRLPSLNSQLGLGVRVTWFVLVGWLVVGVCLRKKKMRGKDFFGRNFETKKTRRKTFSPTTHHRPHGRQRPVGPPVLLPLAPPPLQGTVLGPRGPAPDPRDGPGGRVGVDFFLLGDPDAVSRQ